MLGQGWNLSGNDGTLLNFVYLALFFGILVSGLVGLGNSFFANACTRLSIVEQVLGVAVCDAVYMVETNARVTVRSSLCLSCWS